MKLKIMCVLMVIVGSAWGMNDVDDLRTKHVTDVQQIDQDLQQTEQENRQIEQEIKQENRFLKILGFGAGVLAVLALVKGYDVWNQRNVLNKQNQTKYLFDPLSKYYNIVSPAYATLRKNIAFPILVPKTKSFVFSAKDRYNLGKK